ncbi:glycosyltransferase family 2 protein [Protaetiibacter larvae]|uniref:Glycosyltransferase family 2 protein n=1 Tax=Protaetiibacter larvae TaxID=2592654 RepID=A0A5C1Y716_9MICO|nr:glycosyltransferase family 2 protein [Protaetiibacter larvae]QEO08657.1 glycosyltransferase family 2 protein [Protaetiibacter larvae]
MRRSLARLRHTRQLPELGGFAAPSTPVPAISIIMATYNRSNVLVHAIESVRAQTVDDWELLVVGDACTDDTEEVVASFRDPRIRFVNLPVNMGDQSGPNSVGIRLARGRRIAWLNHDDLWFPDHLAQLVDESVSSGADVVIARMFRVRELRRSEGAWEGRVELPDLGEEFVLCGGVAYQASSWLMDARLARRLRDWKPAARLRYVSSQEYLYRAWSAGATIRIAPLRSLVIIPSIVGGSAYLSRRDDEQRLLQDVVASGDRDVLEALGESDPPPGDFHPSRVISIADRQWTPIRRWMRAHSYGIFRRTAAIVTRLGLAPWEYAALLAGVPRGGTNSILRERRGLS